VRVSAVRFTPGARTAWHAHAIGQTRQRLQGERVIPDRLVSLSDPDARPSARASRAGRVRLHATGGRGRARLRRRPPAPAGQPPGRAAADGAVERVAKVTGRVAGTVVGDRGFGTAANDRALADRGVKWIGLQRKGTVSAARAQLERTRGFRRMRNWRIGIEARISHLKRSFGLRAPGCGVCLAPGPGSGWGSSPTTCSG
jgi:IS5 family transposase